MIDSSQEKNQYQSKLVPKLFFHLKGGGGVGKTFLIWILSQWITVITQRQGDHPFKPKVLLLAPTGIAASLIGMYEIEL